MGLRCYFWIFNNIAGTLLSCVVNVIDMFALLMATSVHSYSCIYLLIPFVLCASLFPYSFSLLLFLSIVFPFFSFEKAKKRSHCVNLIRQAVTFDYGVEENEQKKSVRFNFWWRIKSSITFHLLIAWLDSQPIENVIKICIDTLNLHNLLAIYLNEKYLPIFFLSIRAVY